MIDILGINNKMLLLFYKKTLIRLGSWVELEPMGQLGIYFTHLTSFVPTNYPINHKYIAYTGFKTSGVWNKKVKMCVVVIFCYPLFVVE